MGCWCNETMGRGPLLSQRLPALGVLADYPMAFERLVSAESRSPTRMCVIKLAALAAIILAASRAWAEEVTYNANSGALTLIQDSTWATHTQATGLLDFEVYFAGTTANNSAPYLTSNNLDSNGMAPAGTSQIINAEGTLEADPVNGVNGNGWSGTSYSGLNVPGSVGTFTTGVDNNMSFVGPNSNNHETLPAGSYLLATLPAGLTAADFGNSYTDNAANGSPANGPGDTTGSVFFATGLGAETFDYVHIISSVSSENDWIGASGGLWSTSSNWSLSSGTSTHRVPLSTDTATFGNQYGNLGVGAGGTVNISGTQSVGSLEFNCANSYTLQTTTGTTGLLEPEQNGEPSRSMPGCTPSPCRSP